MTEQRHPPCLELVVAGPRARPRQHEAGRGRDHCRRHCPALPAYVVGAAHPRRLRWARGPRQSGSNLASSGPQCPIQSTTLGRQDTSGGIRTTPEPSRVHAAGPLRPGFAAASPSVHPDVVHISLTFALYGAGARPGSRRKPTQPSAAATSHPVSPVPVSTRGVGFARVRRAASLGPDWGWHLCVEDRTARSRLRTLRRPHDGTMKGSSVRSRAGR